MTQTPTPEYVTQGPVRRTDPWRTVLIVIQSIIGVLTLLSVVADTSVEFAVWLATVSVAFSALFIALRRERG